MKIKTSPEVFVFWGLMILLLPLRWWLAAGIAAIFHEGCHWAAVRCFGGEIREVSVTLGGVKMETSPLTTKQTLISSLAGPLGGLLLLLFGRWIPRVAVCALFQSVFNLLPLMPLDGGRAVKAFLYLFFPDKAAAKILAVIQNGTAAMLLLLCVFSLIRLGARFFPLFVGLWLYRLYRERKTTCKDGVSRVQ